MRVVGVVIAVLAALWTGWWLFAARQIERTAEAFFAERQAEGIDASYSDLDVGGFPYRFVLSLEQPAISAPAIAWTAPRFALSALSYKPNHVIASFADRQTLALADQTIALASTRMQASLRTLADPDLPLDHLTADAKGLGLTSDAGWGLDMAEALIATRRSEMTGAGPFAHDVVMTLTGLTPDAALRARIDPEGRMAGLVGPVRLDASVTLDGEVDRHLFEPGARLPEILALDLRDAGLAWGQAELHVRGALDFDAQGRANGTLSVKIAGWRDLIGLAISLGLVPEGQRDLIEQGLSLVEATRLGARDIDLTLPVQGGIARLGPLPIARLPSALRAPPPL